MISMVKDHGPQISWVTQYTYSFPDSHFGVYGTHTTVDTPRTSHRGRMSDVHRQKPLVLESRRCRRPKRSVTKEEFEGVEGPTMVRRVGRRARTKCCYKIPTGTLDNFLNQTDPGSIVRLLDLEMDFKGLTFSNQVL